jgi:hypothetical protein
VESNLKNKSYEKHETNRNEMLRGAIQSNQTNPPRVWNDY